MNQINQTNKKLILIYEKIQKNLYTYISYCRSKTIKVLIN